MQCSLWSLFASRLLTVLVRALRLVCPSVIPDI
jgi:hypothetical protein